jgi:hypothetical protein
VSDFSKQAHTTIQAPVKIQDPVGWKPKHPKGVKSDKMKTSFDLKTFPRLIRHNYAG